MGPALRAHSGGVAVGLMTPVSARPPYAHILINEMHREGKQPGDDTEGAAFQGGQRGDNYIASRSPFSFFSSSFLCKMFVSSFLRPIAPFTLYLPLSFSLAPFFSAVMINRRTYCTCARGKRGEGGIFCISRTFFPLILRDTDVKVRFGCIFSSQPGDFFFIPPFNPPPSFFFLR